MEHDLDERAPLETRPEGDGRPRDWTRWDWLCLTLITLIGGALRFVGLGDAKGQMFDEIYYAKDACLYAGRPPSVCGIDAPENYVHPPLGKWFISLGVRAFGHNEIGWRVAGAIAGTLTIVVVYLLARKILRSTLGASIASGLFALDFLALVQARVSMLDGFVPLFGVATFLFLAYDKDHLGARLEGQPRPSPARPWRLAAGISAGGAVATKWSGVFFVVAALTLTITWAIGARRRDGRGGAIARALSQEGATILAWLVLVPVLVYLLAYVGRVDGSLLAAPWSDDSWLFNVWTENNRAWHFHRDLEASHPYESPAWSWILLKRPVAYYVAPGAPEGFIGSISTLGNPLVWWSSIPAVVFAAGAWLRRRDLFGPEAIIVAGVAFTYLPWLVLSQDRSAVFLFYLLPVVPFMCIALAYCFVRLGRSIEARLAAAMFMAAVAGLFVFYHPLLVGTVLPYESWERRLLFNDEAACSKPPGEPTTTTTTETTRGRTVTNTVETASEDSLPPKGWCWL